MKNKLILILAVVLAACSSASELIPDFLETDTVQAAERLAPFSKGVNFSGWFESGSAGSIPFTRYTEQDFIDVKSLGVEVIRLPVRMHSMTSGSPDYTLDPRLIKFLKIAVDWAEKYEIYIIIDNHSFDPILPTSPDIDKILIPVWEQTARLFKDRSDYVLYEILNEPHDIDDVRWGEIQGMAVEAIRRIDQKHTIIVGGTGYNSIYKLDPLPRYSDDNLIYTFHFYDPYFFTHQGAGWGDPLMEHLMNIPFPYSKEKMPKVPAKLRGTWYQSAMSNYYKDASPSAFYSHLNKAAAFSRERNVPVFCGEFGVFMRQSPQEDRVTWYKITADALDRRNISRTSWDYYGGFGVFNLERGNFNYDLNVEVVRALGFNPPVQTERVPQALETGFVIYDDYPNNKMATLIYWGDEANLSLYDENSAKGEFAIRWGNVSQYSSYIFDFDLSYRDFSSLVNDGFYLEFEARTQGIVNFDIRFSNSENLIPWRMRYTIDENILPPDGKWHTIRIPLTEMSEQGAWVNSKQKWYTPEGKFSWKDVQRLEFASENSDMKGVYVWFDEIKITKN